MSQISRRSLMGSSLALALLPAAGASGMQVATSTDPVFAVIADYHQAAREYADAIAAFDAPAAPEAAGQAVDDAHDREQACLRVVIRAAPTSRSGFDAWSGFLLVHLGRAEIAGEGVIETDLVRAMLEGLAAYAARAEYAAAI